jgi:uncharacterized membrane protein YebE (DUF533 family)
MSFMKTLATLAVGFAAAKGFDAFNTSDGVSGMQARLKNAGAQGGIADQMGRMAERMGIPGGAATMRGIAQSMGATAANASERGQAGLHGAMGAMSAAAGSGAGAMTGLMPGAVGANAEANAKLMIRAMIQAAKADGSIDADERARILDHLTDADAAEMDFVLAQIEAPIDVDALAADTGAAMRSQVYAAAAMAIRADTPAESDYLAALAQALGLDNADREAVHAATAMDTPT